MIPVGVLRHHVIEADTKTAKYEQVKFSQLFRRKLYVCREMATDMCDQIVSLRGHAAMVTRGCGGNPFAARAFWLLERRVCCSMGDRPVHSSERRRQFETRMS